MGLGSWIRCERYESISRDKSIGIENMAQPVREFKLSEKQIKWITFVILLALFPAVFFIIFDIGIWPVLDVFFRMIPSTVFKGEYKLSIILFVQCAVWLIALYVISHWVSKKIILVRNKLACYGFVLLTIFILAMLPIYGLYYESQKSDSASSVFHYYFFDRKMF